MQKLNSTDNPRLPKDKREKQSSIQYACSKENFRILLEIEVTEGLRAAMSKKNENSIDQSGGGEVTIIRPGTGDPFMHFPQNSATLSIIKGNTKKSNELQHRAKPHQRPATYVTDRCRVPRLDRQQNNSFFAEKVTEGPAINVDEIVGDLPSKVTLESQIIVPENNMKLHHGDHCESFISDLEIPNPEIDQRTVAADVLESCVNLCNSESKLRGITPYVNPLVYQIHLGAKATQQNYPLVELSAAQYILETYQPDESARWNAKRQIIEAMRKTLIEWGSDKKRIADTLSQDTSSLMKCEHCGVISFKKAQILGPTIGDELSAKFNNAQQLHCGDDQKCVASKNAESIHDVSPLNTYVPISRNQFTRNTAWTKSSTSFTKTDAAKDKLKVQKPRIEKKNENPSERKFHRPCYKPDTKLFLQRSTNAESIGTPSVVDTMTAERESDVISQNMTKMTDVGQDKELKTMHPLIATNKFGRCSNGEKNEKSNDARFKNTYSARYSPRQIIAKAVRKPVMNNCRDNRNRSNFEAGHNGTNIQSKKSIPLRNDYEESKDLMYTHYNIDNNNANHTSAGAGTNATKKVETSSSQDSSRKNELVRSLVPPSNIPTKLVKTNSIRPTSSNNGANYLVREKPCTIVGSERIILQINRESSDRQNGNENSVRPKNNDNESQSKAEHWLWKNQALLTGGIRENSQNQCADSNNLSKNLLHRCTTFSNDKFPTDQEYAGNDQLSNSDNDRRSFCSTKNRKLNQIIPDFNYSAPLIGFSRNTLTLDNNLPAQYNGESETTAFSSSSSENVVREWANSFAQVPRSDCKRLRMESNDESPCDTIQNIRAQIDKAIEKCSNYSTVVSEEKLYSHKTLEKPDDSLNLGQKDVLPDIDYITEQYERFKNINSQHFSTDVTIPSNNAAKTVILQSENNRKLQGFKDGDFTASTSVGKMKGEGFKTTDDSKKLILSDNTTKMTTEFGETLSKQKYSAIRSRISKSFNNSSKDPLTTTYENPASVISSSSEYSNGYHQKLEVLRCSLHNGKGENVLQLNESETFERQITYDEISSKDVTTGNKENVEAKSLPVYRKILESKDEMDWETFQQLVGTLHPSQRELWCDICKAVSNEAKRVAGETGASTEVCIEVNPIPISQTFPCKERIRGVKTSGNEISFEMDMTLTDSETFLDQKSRGSPKTLHVSEKCH